MDKVLCLGLRLNVNKPLMNQCYYVWSLPTVVPTRKSGSILMPALESMSCGIVFLQGMALQRKSG